MNNNESTATGTSRREPKSTSGYRSARRPVRPGCRPQQFPFDRVKFFIILSLIVVAFTSREKAENPLLSLTDAGRTALAGSPWVLWLLYAEAARQLHFLVAERVAAYWQAFSVLTAAAQRPFQRMTAYSRYRLSRLTRVVLMFVIGAMVLGKVLSVSPAVAWFVLPARVMSALPMAFQLLFALLFGIFQFVGIFWFMSRGGVETYLPDDVNTRFDQVWGQDRVVERIREVVALLEDPDRIEARGGYVPGGVLLWGPPGTGKTLIAEAMAGETGKPYVFVEPGAFQAMFFGVGIMKVKALYRKLRKLALRYGGVIVFFDEADVLGSRGDNVGAAVTGDDIGRARRAIVPMNGGRGGDLGTLNALLAEMNGLGKPRGFMNRVVRRALGLRPAKPPKYRILHIMATNMPDSLDPALLRPGRIDYKFQVGYPSKEGRRRTFEGYLAKINHNLTDVQIDLLAALTPRASGAMVKDFVNESVMQALRDGREVVTWEDVLKGRSVKTYGIADDFEYVPTERHTLAIHEASHAVAQHHLKRDEMIDVVTIERRGSVGGFVQPLNLEERFVALKSEREAEVCVFLASIAGERLFFDSDTSAGVSGDLESATMMVLQNEGQLGMGETLSAYHVISRALSDQPTDVQIAEEMRRTLAQRVEARLQELYQEVLTLLTERRHEVLALAHALETYRTVNGRDAVAVLEGSVGDIIDGRVYGTEEMRAALEAYHAAVFHARRDGGEIAMALPAAAPRVPRAEEIAALPAPVDSQPATAWTEPVWAGPASGRDEDAGFGLGAAIAPHDRTSASTSASTGDSIPGSVTGAADDTSDTGAMFGGGVTSDGVGYEADHGTGDDGERP